MNPAIKKILMKAAEIVDNEITGSYRLFLFGSRAAGIHDEKSDIEKALDRFGEALQEPESSIVLDATVQRFEFSYELMWKTLKNFLENVHPIYQQ